MKQLYFFIFFILCTANLLSQNEQVFKEIEFLTQDNLKISAVYQYPKIKKESLPAIILIHQGGSSRQEWLDLSITNKLLDSGYAILAYDIRLHGKSTQDGEFSDLFNNPNRAPLDLLAAIQFLKNDNRIDSNRIGIIGASIGANLACVAVSSKLFTIKSAVSLSAKTSAVQNLSGMKDKIVPNNLFCIASKDEQDGKRKNWAIELYNITKGERKIEITTGNKHGSFIIKEHEYLENEIIQWFKKTL